MTKRAVLALCMAVVSAGALSQSCNRTDTQAGDYVAPSDLCDDDFSRLKTPSFSDFPAEKIGVFKPVFPQGLDGYSPEQQHLWMNTITETYRSGIGKFAGHYLFIRRGACGAGCHQALIVDLRDGKVYEPDEIGVVLATVNSLPPTLCKKLAVDCDNDTFTFHPDSKLLVVIGALGESAKKRGVYYFKWDDNKLKLISKVEKSPYEKTKKRIR